MAKLILTITNDAAVTLHTATINLNDGMVARILAMMKATNPNADGSLPNDVNGFARGAQDVRDALKAKTLGYEQDAARKGVAVAPVD
jgi:hypothetical protein